ncbi:MAG: response regulator [Verrucomicrobiota bacterium]|nr:response regulator [Verrucomicrobiota bacterium]
MKKLLLIDDDRVFRASLMTPLREHGWTVWEAEDGETGMNLAREHKPDVIVCDLLMPRFNGFQVCRNIRAQRDIFANTRIVVTTGSGYTSDRSNALDAGADEYLIKPIRGTHLVELLEKFVRERNFDGVPIIPSMPSVEGVKLRFWGVRGSIPTPGPSTVQFGGNTSCVEVRADGELMILDAGTGIRMLGLHLMQEFKDKPINLTLLISHTHWDHIQGFPFFPVAYNPKNSIRVLAFEGARKSLEATLSSQMESPYFPISMQQMPGNIVIEELKDMSFVVGRNRIEAAFTNHPGICVGYKINTIDGSIAYVPDVELFQRMRASTNVEHSADVKEAEDFARRRDQRLVDFLRGADVLIMDSQYDCEEYPRFIGWGHSCVDDTVGVAIEAEVKRLYLFHHDPLHDDTKLKKMEADAQALAKKLGSNLEVIGAREGMEFVLSRKLQKV